MLAAIRGATRDDHLRNLHLLVRRRSARRSPRRSPSGRARASRCTCCSTGSAAARSTRNSSRRWSSAGVEVRRFHEPQWYQPRAAQQPHAPQAADRRRQGRLHRRRRHRRRVARQCAGSGRTGATRISGSKGRSSRRCRRCSWTTGSRSPAKCCTAPTTFRRSTPAGDGRGADVQQLARGRQREHAPDVPARDHRRARDPSTCRARISCPTS